MIMRQKKDRKKKMEAMDTKVQLRRESRLPLDETWMTEIYNSQLKPKFK